MSYREPLDYDVHIPAHRVGGLTKLWDIRPKAKGSWLSDICRLCHADRMGSEVIFMSDFR